LGSGPSGAHDVVEQNLTFSADPEKSKCVCGECVECVRSRGSGQREAAELLASHPPNPTPPDESPSAVTRGPESKVVDGIRRMDKGQWRDSSRNSPGKRVLLPPVIERELRGKREVACSGPISDRIFVVSEFRKSRT